MIGAFAASLRGKLGRSQLRGVHFEETDEITISGESSDVILDGEMFRAERGSPINLRPAQPLSFVKLAAGNPPPSKGGVRGGCAKRAMQLGSEQMSRRVEYDRTQRARALRKNSTDHERKLWGLLSRLRPKFTRQLPIGPYYADFACRRTKLVVELDGGQHAGSDQDRRRDQFLREEGWAVLRIWNNDLDNNPDGVFEAIVRRAAECLGGTHPQPLPSREGRIRRHRFES